MRAFVKESAKRGIDVFRIFDSLNWLPGMEVALEEVLNQDKIAEATICYTGDITDPKRDKYPLEYYVKACQRAGASRGPYACHQGYERPFKALCREKSWSRP